MRIGYSMWGFLGDGVVDTPDGSRAYRRAFVDGLVSAGHEVVLLQANRDLYEAGVDVRGLYRWHLGFPGLDGLIFEWQWPLPGRNTANCGTAAHTCDLHRQTELFNHYTSYGTPTLVWDLDHQLPPDDPRRLLRNVAVGEFALLPTPGATTIPHRVVGKWPHTQAWPRVDFTGRCGFAEVELFHRTAPATVLLVPERYATVGHMTSRWFEALVAGCPPLVPGEIRGVDLYAPSTLLAWLQVISHSAEHADLITACLTYLEPFRCSAQVAVAGKLLEALP
jgi:hypothetical protein